MPVDRVRYGILLAGGESRRMGRPKESLVIGGETLLARTARTLREVANRVLIIGSPERADRESVAGCEWLIDPVAYQGPLAGLGTGLDAIAGDGASNDWAMVVPCDHPGLSASFLKRLINAQEANTDAVIVESDAIWHPFPGLYRVKLASQAKSLSAERGKGLKHLLREVRTRVVAAEVFRDIDPQLLNLRSVDTKDDWDRYQRGE